MTTPDWSIHDDPDGSDRDAAVIVGQGLGDFNEAAAPLHQVRPLACHARDAQGTVIGGALGRTWGACVELQQLWVGAAWRRQGLGARLVLRFEALAMQRGCRLAYLDTFSFQAPSLYARLGYVKVSTIAGFAPGIEKYGMHKVLG